MPKEANYSKFFSTYLRQTVPENHKGEIRLDCPLKDCENPDNHFYANCTDGTWHCKRCDTSGNARNLITLIHEQALEETIPSQYDFLSNLRGISADIFETAGFAYDSKCDRWLVPYYTYDPLTKTFSPFLNNLGYFNPSLPKDGFVIKKSAVLSMYLYNPGMHDYPMESKRAIICEGEWDTLAYYDTHRTTSHLVLGKPGAGFSVRMLQSLSNCNRIDLLLDNDIAGLKQVAKAVSVIQDHKSKLTVYMLDWTLVPSDAVFRADQTNNYAPKDLRDLKRERPATVVDEIESSVIPYDETDISEEEVEIPLTAGYVKDAETFERIPSFQKYVELQRSIFELSEETRLAQAAALAITISQDIPGEPLWAFLISPPSSGKTLFIESFGGTNQWFDNLSKLTAESFVSGWKDDNVDDSSYLPRLFKKTLFVKDFTTTLMGPDEAQRKVFGLLTDIYDGHVKIPFGNNQIREYHNTYFNLIAGVTDIVHQHSAASIGERFLRIDWLGKNYNSREFARRALLNFGLSNEHKTIFTSWTLGFVRYLREQTIDMVIPEEYIDPIIDLAQFIATIRTKVEVDRHEGMKYKPRAELPARLSKQLGKLFVAGRVVVGSNEEAFKVVRKVAFDTSYGFSMDIVNFLLTAPSSTREEIVEGVRIHASRVYRVISDLVTTGVLDSYTQTSKRANGRPRLQYRINPVLLPALQPDKYLNHEQIKDRRIAGRPGPTTIDNSLRRPDIPRKGSPVPFKRN